MSRLRTGLISLGLLLLALAPALGLRAQQDDSAPPIALTYQWERQYYGRINGVEALLYHRSFSRAKLSFADIDGDGDDDIFIGKEDGRIAFFQNIGTPAKPEFRLKMEDFVAFRIELDANQQPVQLEEVIDVGSNAVPELIDMDSDGDLDLF
ncbi:MAG: FG-GAP-like repeat-containing protein, partial [SAR324 cluster bacterium]|nr:FG-GAP-like repeat-containing protein [SAR324 cluster bacterium]